MGVIKNIQYNCRQATLLLENKELTKLSFRESIELRIHLSGCSVCRLYGQQSRAINKMIQQIFKTAEYKLDDNAKKNMQEVIDEELNKK
jgi:hypothetical protein